MEKELIREKGITLIALIVTIVILLILASVTIGLVMSNGGILSKAKQAADMYQGAANNEANILGIIDDQLAGQVDEIEKSQYPMLSQIGKVSDYISYNNLTWQVLYNDSTNGLQAICTTAPENYTVTGSDGYKGLIGLLNAEAEKYKGDENYVSSARCVGLSSASTLSTLTLSLDNSTIASESDMYIINGTETGTTISDLDQLNLTGQKNAMTLKIDSSYWLAARHIYSDANGKEWNGINISTDANVQAFALHCMHNITNTPQYEHSVTAGIRPVVTFATDGLRVMSGDGSPDSPFKLIK